MCNGTVELLGQRNDLKLVRLTPQWFVVDLVPSHGPLILGPIPGNGYEISINIFGRDSHGFVADGH